MTGIHCRFEPGLLPSSFIHLHFNPDGSSFRVCNCLQADKYFAHPTRRPEETDGVFFREIPFVHHAIRERIHKREGKVKGILNIEQGISNNEGKKREKGEKSRDR
jgi:hypothetical protein